MDTRQPNILIAVDGSPPADWALQVGTTLARRLNGVISIVHIIPPPSPDFTEGVLILVEDFNDALKAAGAAILEKAARRLPDDIPVTRVMRQGIPASEILAQARDSDANYIVMGSRGRGRWFHFILGSTAESVVRDAPCPVITVSHDPNHKAFRAANCKATQSNPPPATTTA
jgi:nucleotide-binding universal stress UspA family protein